MAVYELKVENFKKPEGWTEIFYLVPALGFEKDIIGSRLEVYKRRAEGELEQITGAIERGWNLSQGGVVNLRTLTEVEERTIAEWVQKHRASHSPSQ